MKRTGRTTCITAITTLTGLVFSVSVMSFAQTLTTLATLNGANLPIGSSLTQGADGNFYGATSYGGLKNQGKVFRVTPDGSMKTIYSFCSVANCADGSNPNGTLLLGPGGDLYGTTQFGGGGSASDCGSIGCGTVFKLTPAGQFTTLYVFCPMTNCPDGNMPDTGLSLGMNGNLYGTAYYGGACSTCGTIFEVSLSGKFVGEFQFLGGRNGGGPGISLVLANNGYFYGIAGGGRSAGGEIYAYSPSGNLYVVADQSFTNRVNGVSLGADGNLYGTSMLGGVDGLGSIFELTPTGSFSTIYNFCSQSCTDNDPDTGVTQGSDGNFYGTASGGLYGNGALYQFNPNGTYTSLYSFCSQKKKNCPDGSTPNTLLYQGTDGLFYGGTEGGASGFGTIFSLSMGLAPFIKASPNFGRTSTYVGILGNNLTGTSSVTFNGVPASFTVVSNTFLKAQVPSGATTGTIQVTTPSGTLNSNLAFQILP